MKVPNLNEYIRLYPIPYRYLLGEHQFKKYQWVRAKIRKRQKDDRPESHEIQKDSIRLGDIVGTRKDWSVRKMLFLSQPKNLFSSLEDLQKSHMERGTSLGLPLIPKSRACHRPVACLTDGQGVHIAVANTGHLLYLLCRY